MARKYPTYQAFTCSSHLAEELEELCATHRVSKSTALRVALEMYVESMRGVVPVTRKKATDPLQTEIDL